MGKLLAMVECGRKIYFAVEDSIAHAIRMYFGNHARSYSPASESMIWSNICAAKYLTGLGCFNWIRAGRQLR